MDEPGVVVAFWVLAVTAVGSALMVAAVRNLLHAVLFLVLSFVGVAGLYLTLSADFVAVVQVLVYAGAIAVLVLFAIMLTPRAGRDNADGMFWAPALVLAGLAATTIRLIATPTEGAGSGRGATMKREKATRVRLTEFSMSSMPIRTPMALRLASAR